MTRGEIWWAELPEPRGPEPAFHRPVLIVQANSFNRSGIRTVIVAVLTGNLRLAEAPGNLLVPARVSSLPRDSVVNVSQLVTLDRSFLMQQVGELPNSLLKDVDAGLRMVLGL